MKRRALTLLFLLAFAAPGFGQNVLRNRDTFEIRLSGMAAEYAEAFTKQFDVSDEGMVDLPYVGPMKATGLRTTQFARAAEDKLVAEKIFTHPEATLNFLGQARFVRVIGGFRFPGAVVWSTDLTLTGAIKCAGGFGDWGQKYIDLIRDGRRTRINLLHISKDPNQDPRLLPGDEVYLPE